MALQMRDETALMQRYIEPNPHRPGLDDARLISYGVPVWALIGHFLAIGQDRVQTAVDYDIPLEAMDAALAYYACHKPVIEARIAANSPVSAG